MVVDQTHLLLHLADDLLHPGVDVGQLPGAELLLPLLAPPHHPHQPQSKLFLPGEFPLFKFSSISNNSFTFQWAPPSEPPKGSSLPQRWCPPSGPPAPWRSCLFSLSFSLDGMISAALTNGFPRLQKNNISEPRKTFIFHCVGPEDVIVERREKQGCFWNVGFAPIWPQMMAWGQ